MKLNATNRRRALQRRRKLLPEPRRVSVTQSTDSEPTVLREEPAPRARVVADADMEPIDQTAQEPITIQS